MSATVQVQPQAIQSQGTLVHLRDGRDRPEGGCWMTTDVVDPGSADSPVCVTMFFTDSARGKCYRLVLVDEEREQWLVQAAPLGSKHAGEEVARCRTRPTRSGGRMMEFAAGGERYVLFFTPPAQRKSADSPDWVAMRDRGYPLLARLRGLMGGGGAQSGREEVAQRDEAIPF